MKNHISFCVNNSKRLTFCFVNELQDVLRFLYACVQTYLYIFSFQTFLHIFGNLPISFRQEAFTGFQNSNLAAESGIHYMVANSSPMAPLPIISKCWGRISVCSNVSLVYTYRLFFNPSISGRIGVEPVLIKISFPSSSK